MLPFAVKPNSILLPLKSIRLITISAMMLCAVPMALAEDLIGLWEIAKANDAKFLSAEHKYLSDKEVVTQSRADLLPSLAFQYEYKKTHQSINQSDNAVFDSGSDTFPTKTRGFTITQSIFDYARWARYAQSELSSDKALLEYSLAKQQLLLRLAESYFLVLERSDQLETVQAEKAAMQKHLDASKKKHKSGLGRRVDVEDALARYLNALSKEVELQSRLLDSQYALREVLGMMPASLARLGTDMDLSHPEPAIAEDWAAMSAKFNLELQAMDLALQVAEKEVTVLESAHAPTLDLLYTTNNVRTKGSVFGGGSDIDNEEITLQLNMPLFSGGKTTSKIRQAEEKRESAFHDRNDKRRSIERSAHEAYNRISTAIVQVEALAQSVNAQQRLLDSKTSGYQVGQNSMLEILDVEQDLSSAQQALTKSRYDYVLNVLRLKFAAGDLQESDLASVNAWLTGGYAVLR